jgi:hypothetical protein
MALRAYYDDTGTDPDNPIVGWVGYVGDEEQWETAEKAWLHELHRRGLEHFHMTECEAGFGPYGSRAERDALTHDLRKAILDTRLFGVGVLASTAEWNELVPAHLLGTVGTAEQNCINMCVWQAQSHSHQIDRDREHVALFFDSAGDTAHISAAVKWFNEQYGRSDPHAFVAMKCTPAIQMADMLAWELRQVCGPFFETGVLPNPRPHFASLVNLKWMTVYAINRIAIERIVAEAVKGTPAGWHPSLDYRGPS